MSPKGIESVLTRAMSDPEFANQLFSDAEQALVGFDLTADEVTQLKSMSRADFDKFSNASPEDRKSFVILIGSNHNEGIQ